MNRCTLQLRRMKNKKYTEPCETHNPKELPYLKWFEWAENKYRKGEMQKQCPKCKRWYFKEEY